MTEDAGLVVEPLGHPTPDEMAELDALVPQLSASARLPVAWPSIVGVEGTTVFVARTPDGIVGMLTLVTFTIPTGRRAMIEDVVVDDRARGKGAGLALVNAALAVAAEFGAATVDLTSRPAREAANRLYERAGFVRRETNVWRRVLD
jgi:ribosomal protein S18 acetylase RimI-like enzyme